MNSTEGTQKNENGKQNSQPMPKPGKESVTEHLLKALRELEPQQNSPFRRESIRAAIEQIEAQQRKGIEKYGRSLETWNGRDPLADAMQEEVDRWQYMVQAQLERADLRAQIAALRSDYMELEAVNNELKTRLKSETLLSKPQRPISDLVRDAFGNSVTRGFWNDVPLGAVPRTVIPLKLMLMVTELGEAMEAYREEGEAVCVGAAPTDYEVVKGKPEGILAELADVCIRVFDLCGAFDWDLDRAIKEKMTYNAGRPYRHGGKKA